MNLGLNIEYLFLLVLLIPYIVWYVMKRKNMSYASGFGSHEYMTYTLKAVRFTCCIFRLYSGWLL